MRCVDIYSEPGILKPGFIGSNADTAGTVTDLVRWIVNRDGANTNLYAIGDTARVYTSEGSSGPWSRLTGNTSTGTGNGMAAWKNTVFAIGVQGIDAYHLGSQAWINASGSGWIGSDLESDSYHPAIVGQDDIVYIGNGRYVASLQEVSGQTFHPSLSASYAWNAQALDLPSGYRV